jgi:hypothetical protein
MLTFSYSNGQLQKGLFGPAMLHGLAGAHKLATQGQGLVETDTGTFFSRGRGSGHCCKN